MLATVGVTIAGYASVLVDGTAAKLVVWAATQFAFVFLWSAGVLWWAVRHKLNTKRPIVLLSKAVWRPVRMWVHRTRGRKGNRMADETAGYGKRLRDLEAQAFRTGRTLAGHSEQLATIRGEQHAAPGSIDSGAIGRRLDAIERVLFALARAQGIDPAASD